MGRHTDDHSVIKLQSNEHVKELFRLLTDEQNKYLDTANLCVQMG